MTFLNELEQRIGQQHVLTGQSMQQYLEDWRGRYTGTAVAVARPATTQEVAQVVRLCAEHRVPIVPQGGNTGLCGGATPDNTATALVLSLERLNKIRSVDTENDTMVVEAGCILQNVQQAARDHQRLFPLSLAAEGSCTIGGNLATNAGGTQVLRYGNARDLTLGLEVVTAQGEILHGLHGLRKDNTGYDLRNLFIGSEGTLGIITAATIKLYPQPVAASTALLALDTIEDAVHVLALARQGLAASLTGFELIAGNCLQAVLHCYPDQRMPFQGPAAQAAWYALLELSDSESLEHARERFESVIGQALEQELVQDAVIAETIAQSKALWHLRESIPLAEKAYGKSIKHDVSIPVSLMAQFVHETDQALQDAFPGLENVTFGHLGDGNLHYNVARGTAFTEEELLKRQDEIYTLVHDSVHRFQGSISAEHGVGQLKRQLLPRYKDPVALSLMKQIKLALDPLGIMNPGKVLPD
ncbi:FAD-binding oxidoreductase [Alcaligenes sp. CHO6]|uniref:FAD-binding oxidoreductase n=1 Tax=unclassified Alcaligenes TaxID=259357 RepID=UPI002B60E4D0|nr:FAD-binding oxidoreductase [Alcaligenes faecalis]